MIHRMCSVRVRKMHHLERWCTQEAGSRLKETLLSCFMYLLARFQIGLRYSPDHKQISGCLWQTLITNARSLFLWEWGFENSLVCYFGSENYSGTRHEGLKIPWPARPCGFDSRPGHKRQMHGICNLPSWCQVLFISSVGWERNLRDYPWQM